MCVYVRAKPPTSAGVDCFSLFWVFAERFKND